jgi:uncharacterized membrane protein
MPFLLQLPLRRLRVLLVLAGLAFGLNALLFVRCFLIHDWLYAKMLPWNLVLAFVPIPLALWAERLVLFYRMPKFKLAAVVAAWALFFPNAPYLVTDIKHLHWVPPMPLWFDATLLFGFAMTGLFAGLVSLYWMHRLGRHFLGPKLADALLAAYLPVAAWGIFLGRELRWNTWDVLIRPHHLVWDALTRGTSLKAVLMTVEFSMLMGVSYLAILALIHLNPRQD